MNLEKLGSRIREQRQRKGLRQADIANALRISAQAVSKWERGENAPDITVLLPLAQLLGVSVDGLLGASSAPKDKFEATVFCTSLNGFAKRAAELSPSEVAQYANSIFYPLTEAVLQHEGVPVKYVGDGFLAFFTGVDHDHRALAAARRAKRLLDTPNLIVAINTGEVYLGTIGHPDYARPDIIGETVNTAFIAMSWIADNCVSGVGIIDPEQEFIEAAGLNLDGKTQTLGREEPIEVYSPRVEGMSA